MRVLLGCGFWAAIALTLFLGAHAFPVGDSSGEEEIGEDPSRGSPGTVSPGRLQRKTCAQLAHLLQRTAATWNNELCKENNACKGSMEMLILNNLHLPKIVKEDRCYDQGFEKETCLRSLSSGLYAFQTFLEYIEETSISNEEGSTSIWPSTRHLADTLKSMMNNPETVTMPHAEAQKTLSTKLREHRGWNITVIKHLILQDFTSFMEKAARAIRVL